MKKIKNVYIYGGGTVNHVTNHFSISSQAYGNSARNLFPMVSEKFDTCNVFLKLTRMANEHSNMVTTQDVSKEINKVIADPNTKCIFFSCAIPDYAPEQIIEYPNITFGKHTHRLESNQSDSLTLKLIRQDKIISKIRKHRKDIFLVGFKTTLNADNQTMYEKGLSLCKKSSVNLVLVNDLVRRHNMIVTPEEAAYHETTDRWDVLKNLVDMAWHRSHLTFTRSTVIDGQPISWNDERIPDSIRTIVNYAIDKNAYKVFNNSTVGHFAIKLSDTEFLTSIRKSNFNDLHKTGMVYVKTDGPDTVLAYGAKPSVGGQSQRIIFRDHEGMDCVVHFHCPLREDHPDDIPVVSQREVECGSHQCGAQTSGGLKEFEGGIKVVMLDNHGPNIVFNRNIDPQVVIDFIERNFDLSLKTGGYNL